MKCALVGGEEIGKAAVERAEVIKELNARALQKRLHRTCTLTAHGDMPALRERP